MKGNFLLSLYLPFSSFPLISDLQLMKRAKDEKKEICTAEKLFITIFQLGKSKNVSV
jgi:hypothetical protein